MCKQDVWTLMVDTLWWVHISYSNQQTKNKKEIQINLITLTCTHNLFYSRPPVYTHKHTHTHTTSFPMAYITISMGIGVFWTQWLRKRAPAQTSFPPFRRLHYKVGGNTTKRTLQWRLTHFPHSDQNYLLIFFSSSHKTQAFSFVSVSWVFHFTLFPWIQWYLNADIK